jgi:hypothetical protein
VSRPVLQLCGQFVPFCSAALARPRVFPLSHTEGFLQPPPAALHAVEQHHHCEQPQAEHDERRPWWHDERGKRCDSRQQGSQPNSG